MGIQILKGDCREILPTLETESVHCVVTSPPYFGLRDYGVAGQIGLEPTPGEFIAELVAVFTELRRVLRKDGTVWLNLGDSYATAGGYGGDQAPSNVDGKQRTNEGARQRGQRPQVIGFKHKDLLGIPWRIAFALQADGWYLRQDIIWSKPNPMPESVRDRCTKSHEYLFLLSKSERYHYDTDAITEPAADPAREIQKTFSRPLKEAYAQGPMARGANGVNHQFSDPERLWGQQGTRNKRSVWEIAAQPFPDAHFATFPPALIEPCILAGCPRGGTVLDPFGGAGTTGLVADRLGRNAVLIELNPAYAAMAERRIRNDAGMFAEIT